MDCTPSYTVEDAYEHCLAMARNHYENFPVASLLVPRRLRPHIAAVYAFARTADDFADEDVRSEDERLALLSQWRSRLDAPGKFDGSCSDAVFTALHNTIEQFSLPLACFHDLLDAFTQDVTVKEYESFTGLLSYCRRSANPVGRIILHLFDVMNDERAEYSDALCTGLQLANFWQDISLDLRKPRTYVPKEYQSMYGIDSLNAVCEDRQESASAMVRDLVERTRGYFRAAAPLFKGLPKGLALELRATLLGGSRILDMVGKLGYRVLSERPSLGRIDAASILLRSLFSAGRRRI
jgi:squalene synthase HpnC